MTDIATLFARDPQDLSNQDIDLIIQRYRDSRKQFALGDRKAGKPAKSPTQKKGEALAAKLDLNLDDLL